MADAKTILTAVSEELVRQGIEPTDDDILRLALEPREPLLLPTTKAEINNVIMFGEPVRALIGEALEEHTVQCPHCAATHGLVVRWDGAIDDAADATFTCPGRHSWSCPFARIVALGVARG